MHVGGAMEILMECFNTGTTKLVGWWRSNEMLHYLHTSTQGFTSGLAACMVQNRDYALIPPAYGG